MSDCPPCLSHLCRNKHMTYFNFFLLEEFFSLNLAKLQCCRFIYQRLFLSFGNKDLCNYGEITINSIFFASIPINVSSGEFTSYNSIHRLPHFMLFPLLFLIIYSDKNMSNLKSLFFATWMFLPKLNTMHFQNSFPHQLSQKTLLYYLVSDAHSVVVVVVYLVMAGKLYLHIWCQ